MEKSQNRKPFQALRDLFHPVDLTHGTCWRTILQFSLPVILSYLLQQEEASETPAQEDHPGETASPTKEDSIINDFLSGPEEGRIVLDDHSGKQLVTPQLVEETGTENDIFTEALARIYIKQGKYDRAIEIIRRLSLKYPKKNRYFADQIRFLEKLIINNNNK